MDPAQTCRHCALKRNVSVRLAPHLGSWVAFCLAINPRKFLAIGKNNSDNSCPNKMWQSRPSESRYAYLPPTPEVKELWKIGKALGPEYLLSPEGEAELKDESSVSLLRLHVLFALASTETLNRLPHCRYSACTTKIHFFPQLDSS